MMIKLAYSSFTLDYDGQATYTRFSDGTWTGGPIVEGDGYHAKRLGISAPLHRFQHEYVHHVVGMEFYQRPYSDVLWQAAHPAEAPPATNLEEEWIVTALQYEALKVSPPEERNDADALRFFASRANLPVVVTIIRSLTSFLATSARP
jgi:hypothetical protein